MPPPADTKRINGPEVSRDYRWFLKDKAKAGNDHEDDGRQQRRGHRPLYMRTGVVTQAQGSAYLEQGNTKVVCAVYGPREIPRRSDFSTKGGVMSCLFQRAPFASPARKSHSFANWNRKDEAEDKELSAVIKEAVEATVIMHLYPKSQIDLNVTVLENDGSVLAASLTCAGLALADASIHMFDSIVGLSAVRIGSRFLVDPGLAEEELCYRRGLKRRAPNEEEEEEAAYLVTVGIQPSGEQLSCVWQEGVADRQVLEADLRQLAKLSLDLAPSVQKCLIESVKEKHSHHQQAQRNSASP